MSSPNTAADMDLSEVIASSGFPVIPEGAYEAMASLSLTEVNGVPTIKTTYTVVAVLETAEEGQQVDAGFEHGEITMLNENAKYSIGKIDKLLAIVGKTRAELKTVSNIIEAGQNINCVISVKHSKDKKDKSVTRANVIESSIQAA